LDDTEQFSDASLITPSRFPNLRHLELHDALPGVGSCEELRSLQTLKIMVLDDDGWSELLKACRKSLISLQITRIYGDYTYQVTPVAFPDLRYLKIVDEVKDAYSWASPLATPALQAYWEESSYLFVQDQRECAQSITHLRLKRVPSMLPTQLRVLQLDLSVIGFHFFLSELKNRHSPCRHLQILEFGETRVHDSDLADMEKALEIYDWQILPALLRPPTITSEWSLSLPGEIEAGVRDRLRFE